MTALSSIIGRGVVASRPSAGTTGALYYATDVSGGQLQRDNGSSWDSIEFGGSGGGWTAISTQTASGAVASLSFPSIPGTYTHLALVGMVRANDSATRYIALQLNTDTGSNYGYQWVYTNTNTTASANAGASVASMLLGQITDGTSTASFGSPVDIRIPAYANTNWKKMVTANVGHMPGTSGSGEVMAAATGYWDNTAAITQIDVIASSGNLANHSVLTLYGLS